MAAYYSKKLYRSRRGEIFGVCKGIADWKDLPVGPIRLAVVLIALTTAVVPVLVIYILAALVMPVEPKATEQRFYDNEDIGSRYKENRNRTVNDLKREFDNLKSKVSGMEGKIFDEDRDKEKQWEKRFNNER